MCFRLNLKIHLLLFICLYTYTWYIVKNLNTIVDYIQYTRLWVSISLILNYQQLFLLKNDSIRKGYNDPQLTVKSSAWNPLMKRIQKSTNGGTQRAISQ